MTVPSDYINAAAHELLNTVIDIYTAENISLPSRRYVSEGTVVHDCELVAIELRRVFRGGPGSPVEPIVMQRCAGHRAAEFRIHIVRCTSVPQENGQPPSVTTINNLSAAIYTDALVLPLRLQTRAAANQLSSPCNDILIGELTLLEPRGGFGGVVMPVEWLVGS